MHMCVGITGIASQIYQACIGVQVLICKKAMIVKLCDKKNTCVQYVDFFLATQ